MTVGLACSDPGQHSAVITFCSGYVKQAFDSTLFVGIALCYRVAPLGGGYPARGKKDIGQITV